MSGLVGYGSSDEEDNHGQDARPAKVAKPASNNADVSTARATKIVPPTKPLQQPTASEPNHQSIDSQPAPPPFHQPEPSASTPAPGPSIPHPHQSASAPGSSYTTARQQIQNLTMPTIPNFDIPSSPSPPPPTSEKAATLAATTKKFERFLALKNQQGGGVHFHHRLANSASLRNPALLAKLTAFAGIDTEASYASTLSVEDGLGVPTRWDESCYVENLVKANEKRVSAGKREGGGRMEFVAAKSATSSARGTPSGDETRKKSRFDKR